MAVPKKRTSKSKKNIRKNAWKTKVEKQAIRSLSLAKYLLKTKPEDPAVEKLLNRLNDETSSQKSITEGEGNDKPSDAN